MKKASIRARRFYAVRGADRVVVPALVLDNGNALWDRVPGEGAIVYRPAPAGSRWSLTINGEPDARRGILTVLPQPGAGLSTEEIIPGLNSLVRRARKLRVPESGELAVARLQTRVKDPFLLDVVSDSRILMPWDGYVSGERLHTCPVCGSQVAMNAASRLRAHPDDTGASCERSNTPLSERERSYEQ